MEQFGVIPIDEEFEDRETVTKEFKEKVVDLGEKYVKEAEEREDEPSEESDEEEAWDAETILSTYTNTDNHPGVIKTDRRVRPAQRMKIELHKQFRVPIDGLIPMAEEIVKIKEKK